VVEITPTQWKLLDIFLTYPGRSLAVEYLSDAVWGYPNDDGVKWHISNLRKNLGEPTPITNVRGYGYRYVQPEAK